MKLKRECGDPHCVTGTGSSKVLDRSQQVDLGRAFRLPRSYGLRRTLWQGNRRRVLAENLHTLKSYTDIRRSLLGAGAIRIAEATDIARNSTGFCLFGLRHH